MSEYELNAPAGWVCPVCGRVFAPWVPECTYHTPGLTNMYPQDKTDPYIDYVHKESVTQPNINAK